MTGHRHSALYFVVSALLLAVLFNPLRTDAAETGIPLRIALENGDHRVMLWTDDSGVPHGLDITVTRTVLESLGYDVRFAPMPWVRALLEMRRGSVDGIMTIAKTEDRSGWIAYPEEPNVMVKALFLVDPSIWPDTTDMATIAEAGIAVRRGYQYSEATNAIIGEYRVDLRDSRQIFDSVRQGRVGAALHNFSGIQRKTASGEDEWRIAEPFPEGLTTRPTPDSAMPLYTGFQATDAGRRLAEVYSDALRGYKETEAYRETVDEFLALLPGLSN